MSTSTHVITPTCNRNLKKAREEHKIGKPSALALHKMQLHG